MRYCTRCCYPHNTRPPMSFDEQGVCSGCRIAEKRNGSPIDWSEREKQLRELCNQHRKNGSGYDCLVPGSGGKDSFYAAHVLKHKYKMKPLTVTWAPHIYTEIGFKNVREYKLGILGWRNKLPKTK